MSNKIKTFVANYLATFLEGAFVEAEGDIKHYPKKYTFSKVANTSEPPPERQGEFLPSNRPPLFKTKPSPTSVIGIVKSVSADTTALAASKKSMADKASAVLDTQRITKEKGIETRNKEDLKYRYPASSAPTTGKAARKARHDIIRQKYRSLDAQGPAPSSIKKEKQIDVSGKEQHPGTGLDTQTVNREPLPARPIVTSKWGRSGNTGAVRVKSQATKWEPEKKQGPYTITAPGVSSLHPNYQPPIRADIPAAPHVATAVTNALMRATKDPAKRKLFSLQKQAKDI